MTLGVYIYQEGLVFLILKHVRTTTVVVQRCQHFDYDFYNGVVSVLVDYRLPMKLTARIVRSVSSSFRKNRDTYSVVSLFMIRR